MPRPLSDAPPLDIGDAAASAVIGFKQFLQADDGTLDLTLPDGPLAGWRLSRGPDRRSVTLTRAGKALAAFPNATGPNGAGPNGAGLGEVDDPSQPECRFLPLNASDLAILRGLTSANWLTERDAPQPAALLPDFRCRVGSFAAELGWNLPLDPDGWPNRLTLLHEGWRVQTLHRFRPLIYTVAYGAPGVMEQLRLCLASLLTIGRYQGDVVVITDKPPSEITALAPSGLKERLAVLPTAAHDLIGYYAARFAITQWPGAWDFQPLLYVDVDTLFDRPVEPLLRAIARSGRISAALEPYERLAESDAVGHQLIAVDGGRPQAELRGFNAGILGIPNMATHAATLRLMGRVMQNRLMLCGRKSLPFPDQAVANYVSFRLGQAVDTELMTSFVRLANAEKGPEGRRGIIHFCWVPDMVERVEAMRRYWNWLLALNGKVIPQHKH